MQQATVSSLSSIDLLYLPPSPRKRWTLFAPSDGPRLYPTRVPYEESTVFSAANLRRPDFAKFPGRAGQKPPNRLRFRFLIPF